MEVDPAQLEMVVHLQEQVQGEFGLFAGGESLGLLVLTRQDRVELLVQPLEAEQTADALSSPSLAWMGQQVLQRQLDL